MDCKSQCHHCKRAPEELAHRKRTVGARDTALGHKSHSSNDHAFYDCGESKNRLNI